MASPFFVCCVCVLLCVLCVCVCLSLTVSRVPKKEKERGRGRESPSNIVTLLARTRPAMAQMRVRRVGTKKKGAEEQAEHYPLLYTEISLCLWRGSRRREMRERCVCVCIYNPPAEIHCIYIVFLRVAFLFAKFTKNHTKSEIYTRPLFPLKYARPQRRYSGSPIDRSVVHDSSHSSIPPSSSA